MLENMPNTLSHHLEYHMSENKLINYRIYAGETMVISRGYDTADRSNIDHSEKVRQHAYTLQYYQTKSNGVFRPSVVLCNIFVFFF